jgi:acyl carrier protein
VPRDEVQPESGELKIFLKQHLPDYMIPALFIPLMALPLSPSGKVDRKALPLPDATRSDLQREYIAPRTDTEARLAAIAVELLGLDRVGATDNFFDLGGHSLLATQFVSRVRDTFQIDLPLRTLFEHPTIAELAIDIEQMKTMSIATVTAPAIKPIERSSRRIKRTDLARGDGNGQHAEEPEPMRTAS